jgi:hypothetical protein
MENYCIKMNHTDSTCSQVSEIQKMTPRLLLQLLGTECGRNIIHPNIWINALFSEYVKKENIKINSSVDEIPVKFNYPKWIITDCRFPNELQAVKDRGGITIRVNRKWKRDPIINTNNHPSETALDNAEFDYVIDNSGGFESLIKEVKKILIKEKII